MAKRKTTPKERREYLDQQWVDRGKSALAQGRPDKFLRHVSGQPVYIQTGDPSFIDRKGEIIRPNREEYHRQQDTRDYNQAHELNKKYDSLISKYGKDSKKVYNFEKKELGMYRRKPSKMEGALIIIGLAAGLLFLSPNLTGNVISNLSPGNPNIIGSILLLAGIVGAFFYFKAK
jgi:hypothetical protein